MEEQKTPNFREWSLKEIQEILSRPLPESVLKTKQLKNTRIPYLPWYAACKILNKYCHGWVWEIVQFHVTQDRLFLIGRLTIPTSDGDFYREATGTESLDCSSYGDASSNAESMAFRRCAAKFGLGLHLYDK